MKVLVSAQSFMRLPDGDPPKEIVYIPEGDHVITPLVNGKPKTITVRMPADRGVAIAAMMQAELEKRLSHNVRPHLDFDHKRSGPASAIPTAFTYREGVGLILSLDWTESGRSAVSGRDYSYFSPDFLLNDDGTPGGLPERGPVGTLCNQPAFREIPRIAATDAATDHEPTTTSTMKRLAAHLKVDDSRVDLEDVFIARVSAMEGDVNKLPGLESDKTALQAKVDDLQKQLDDLKAQADAAAGEKADKAVAAACEAGRIAPKDEATKAIWKDRIMAADWAVDALNALPVLHPALGKQVIVRAGDNSNRGGSDFEAKAKALVSAGEASDIDTAFGILAERDPASYGEYLGNLS